MMDRPRSATPRRFALGAPSAAPRGPEQRGDTGSHQTHADESKDGRLTRLARAEGTRGRRHGGHGLGRIQAHTVAKGSAPDKLSHLL